MTGEIWEDDLGFERPSFGLHCQLPGEPGAPGPCWGCLPSPNGQQACTVRAYHPPSPPCPPTAGDQLGPCDLPSSTRHQHPTQADMQWPNPILDKHQEATRGGFFFAMLVWAF